MGKHLNPNEITVVDNCYFIEDTKLTNFTLNPVNYDVRCFLNDSGEVQAEEHLLLFEGINCQRPDEPKEIVFDLAVDKDSTKILKRLPPDFVMFLSPSSNAKFLNHILIKGMEQLKPRKNYYYERQGYFRQNGVPCYNLCDLTLAASDEIEIRNSCKSHILSYSKKDIFIEWVQKYTEAKNFEPLLLLSALSPYTRHLIEKDSGDDRRFVTFIKAPTSTGKTTHMELIVKISDDNFNMFSLSSDRKGLNKMGEIVGVPLLIDDFNKTKSDSIFKSNIRKLSDMIGQFQSPTRRVIDDKEVGLNEGFFVTAEKYINNSSTINRGVVVELQGPFDSKEMTELQEHKALYIGLIVDFIKHLLVNEDRLQAVVNNNRTFILGDTELFSRYKPDHKIFKTRETLMLTKLLLMDYFSRGLFLRQEFVKKIDDIFTESINRCILKTFELANHIADIEDTEYVEGIYELIYYRCKEVKNGRIAEKCRIYRAYPSSKCHDKANVPIVLGFYAKKNDCFCFKSENLKLYFENLIGFKSKPTCQKIINQLEHYKLLLYRGGDNTFCYKNNYDLGRFLYIKRMSLIKKYEQIRLEKYGEEPEVNCEGMYLSEYRSPYYFEPPEEYKDNEVGEEEGDYDSMMDNERNSEDLY